MTPGLLIPASFFLALVSAAAYYRFALKYGPFAVPNFRSLHQTPVPRGGGLAIAVAVLVAAAGWQAASAMAPAYAMIYLAGGTVITLLGVADDRWDLSARIRMPCQALAAGWVGFWMGGREVIEAWLPWAPLFIGWAVLGLALVWFYNLYNFIDGIDGMAGTATMFIGTTMGVVLWLHGQPVMAGLCGCLAAASAAFLMFNWPPAQMFMGEAGSSFASYVFSAIMVASVRAEPALLWYWLLAGACYFSDTTLTTSVRVLTVPGWYRPHRSHAYQNLARVWGSHRRVLLLVMSCNMGWILPLLVLASVWPQWAMPLTLVAYLPIAIFCLKFGPRFENK